MTFIKLYKTESSHNNIPLYLHIYLGSLKIFLNSYTLLQFNQRLYWCCMPYAKLGMSLKEVQKVVLVPSPLLTIPQQDGKYCMCRGLLGFEEIREKTGREIVKT